MELIVRGKAPVVARIPTYESVADADEGLEIARKREQIADLNKKAMQHIQGATEAAGGVVITAEKTTLDLTKVQGEIRAAEAENELNEDLQEIRNQTARARALKEMHDATAAATKSAADSQEAGLEARKRMHDASERFAIPPEPDPQVVAQERSAAEQEELENERVRSMVLDVSSWTYPVTDEEGYYAYAACQYFGPRLDEGKSHEEAVAIAVRQLLLRRKLHGPFPKAEAEELARRASGMWTNWRKRMRKAQTEEAQRKTADTIFDAARMQREAAERLHDIINGGETNEEFDATK
ncbi:MAG TPA: hypothetical protein VGF28_11095 [Thermoanaerobaculia bacterium]|jgi:hypothetical protein